MSMELDNFVDVSVVIATRNRANNLEKVLYEWSNIDTSYRFEVIIVDNGSTDGTNAILTNAQKKYKRWLRVFDEPRKGVSNARNCGAYASFGNILFFTDDDCYPDREVVSELVNTFTDSSIGFSGGRVLLYDPGDLPLTLQESTIRKDINPYTFLSSGTIHGANMSFRRECFLEVGGFDSNLGPGNYFSSGEDTDIMRRAVDLGYLGRYEPNMIVYHHHRRNTEIDRNKLHKSYDRGMGAGFMKLFLRSNQRLHTLKQFYWHLRTMPLIRSVRQLGYFFAYGVWRIAKR